MIDSKISVTESNTELITLSAVVGKRTVKLQITKVDGQFKYVALASMPPDIARSSMNTIYFNSLEEIDAALQLLSKAKERKEV